ncbi:MAG: endonuclease IV [Clostridiales bacterium]|nr:endonuclease IV [Clostridiales bacterium]
MIKFGPSGNSDSFYEEGNKKTEQTPLWLKKRDLDLFEYSFGRGVNLGDEKATILKDIFSENGIEISVHAPYYINFAGTEENAGKSINYLIESAKKVKLLGGNRVIFHPATQGKLDRETAVNLTKERLKGLVNAVYENNLEDIKFCPETMGKLAQIGTTIEIVDFCKIDKIFLPCIDFGHINAREQGSLKTKEDYLARLNYLINELGFDRVKNFHVHFSKIEYTAKGELRHLTFDDNLFGPPFEPFVEALIELGLEPFVLCESNGTQAEDSIKMKKIYKGKLTL